MGTCSSAIAASLLVVLLTASTQGLKSSLHNFLEPTNTFKISEHLSAQSPQKVPHRGSGRREVLQFVVA